MRVNNTKIKILKGDITVQMVDAVVNAANLLLLGGGGVDGAIHHAAGPGLLEECRTLGGCRTGDAKITRGYDLPAKFVIHAVGPIYGREDGQEEALLVSCYLACLNLAKDNDIKSIAFPAISTGAFRFPKEMAAKIALRTMKEFIQDNPDVLEEVVFVLFDDENYRVYGEELEKYKASQA